MKTHILLASLIFTACGAPDNSATTDADKNKGGQIENQPDKKEVVVEYRKNGTVYALAVADTKDMPACDKNNSKQLVYVKNQDKFYSCEEAQWEHVPVKGEKGETGPQGPAASPIPVNQWYDTITHKYWLIGGSANYAVVATYNPACTGAWRLPTRAEAMDGALHGLGAASSGMGGPTDMWTSELDATFPTTHAYIVRISPTVQESAKPMTESHGAYCIQK